MRSLAARWLHRPVKTNNTPPEQSVLVSVLIVNYRAYTELASCLDSLQRYLANDLEVIVVDHVSEPAATAQLVERFPWIRLIEVGGNPGFAAGINRAAREAGGRYLLLLNPDCIVEGDVGHAMAAWLDAHPLGVGFEHGLGKLPVERRVHDHARHRPDDRPTALAAATFAWEYLALLAPRANH